MRYRTPLSAEETEAYLSMPKNTEGFVVSLFFTPPAERAAYEEAWRVWSREWPKDLHPTWFGDWAEYKHSGLLPTYCARLRA